MVFRMAPAGCCCCRDFYMYNNDSANVQVSTKSGSLVSKFKYSLPHGLGFLPFNWAIDYRNKITFFLSSFSGSTALFRTNDLDWKDQQFLSILTFDGPGLGSDNSIACNYTDNQVYYVSYSTYDTIQQVRGISYEGTNDFQLGKENPIPDPILAPTATANVTILRHTLSYYNNKVYYIRRYIKTVVFSPLEQEVHYELRSISTQTGVQQTEIDLETHPINPGAQFTYVDARIAHSLNSLAASILDNRGVNEVASVALYDLDSGARSDVINDTNSGGQYFRFFGAQHALKDGRIYYAFAGINPNGNQHNGLASISRHGGDEQIVCNFAGEPPDGPPIIISPGGGGLGYMRLGCGLEAAGPNYNGVG